MKKLKKRRHDQPTVYHGAPSLEAVGQRLQSGRYTEFVSIPMSREWAMPNHQTFKIGPIARLLQRYVGDGKGWADPFAGQNSPAQYTNDLNPAMPTRSHMEARDFAKLFSKGKLRGVLFDPPYSFRQVSEHYKIVGKKATREDTSMLFYERVKSAICEAVAPGGFAISCGWNSNGFGKRRGFRMVEILVVAHGGSKNDTIVVVEQKV